MCVKVAKQTRFAKDNNNNKQTNKHVIDLVIILCANFRTICAIFHHN